MQAKPDEELKPAADDLLFFADETGHETFAGNQAYYGLGGCVVLGAGYPHLIRKWREVRTIISGDAEAALHASGIAKTTENFAALSQFFLDHSFLRIAAMVTKEASFPNGMHPCVPVMGQLRQEIAILTSAIPCKRLWIIVESSQRADPIVRGCFEQLNSLETTLPVSVEHCFMPKISREPGLEVADFIISAAGSQVRRRMRGEQGDAPDFKDVFCRLPVDGCRYREITAATLQPDGTVSVDGFRLAS